MLSDADFWFKFDVDVPLGLNSWLEYGLPITDRLMQLTGDGEVNRLSQTWTNVSWWDMHVLQLDGLILQREITVTSNGTPYWYARTVIPQTCFNLEPSFYNRLEHESIKNLIFNEKKVQLKQRIIYPVNEQCIEYYWVKRYISSVQSPLWVRISVFHFLNQHYFYLTEVLFPCLAEITQ